MNVQILCDATVTGSPRPLPGRKYSGAIVVLVTGVVIGAIGGVAALRHSLSAPAEMLPIVPEIDAYAVFRRYTGRRGHHNGELDQGADYHNTRRRQD